MRSNYCLVRGHGSSVGMPVGLLKKFREGLERQAPPFPVPEIFCFLRADLPHIWTEASGPHYGTVILGLPGDGQTIQGGMFH